MQASPSKARAEALEAHAWSLVLSWLSTLYHPSSVPYIERNPETLKALQGLMAENLAADQIRALISAAQREEVGTGAGNLSANNEADSLLRLVESSLPSKARPALESLAESAVLLGRPVPTAYSSSSSSTIIQDIQSQIINLPRQMFALDAQLSSIDVLIADLNRQITQIRQTLAIPDLPPSDSAVPILAISSPSPSSTTDSISALHAQTLQHQRETKQLALKCAEYKERIAALERQAAVTHGGSGGGSITLKLAGLVAKQDSVRRKKAKIDALETKLRAVHGLPPDLEASRAEVHRAEAELDTLRRKRDALFGWMGG